MISLLRKELCINNHAQTPDSRYRNGRCKKCAIAQQVRYQTGNAKRANWYRWYMMKKKYDLTKEQYEAKVLSQNGECSICHKLRPLVVDHNHRTNQIRGLLCSSCNALIGFAYETSEILNAAIGYLNVYKK